MLRQYNLRKCPRDRSPKLTNLSANQSAMLENGESGKTHRKNNVYHQVISSAGTDALLTLWGGADVRKPGHEAKIIVSFSICGWIVLTVLWLAATKIDVIFI